MKPLHFASLFPPHVADPMGRQAHESLRPYLGYLQAAKRAAREREQRSVVAWEPVPAEHQLRLTPLDQVLEVAPDAHAYRLEGWSGKLPADVPPLFVGDEFRPLPVLTAAPGPVLRLAEALPDGSVAHWRGVRVVLRAIADARKPVRAVRADGSTATLRASRESAGRWRVVVEGVATVTLLDDAGAVLPTRAIDPEQDATTLFDDRTPIPWSRERAWSTSQLPSRPQLVADNGVRWEWSDASGRRRRPGVWIQLLAPDDPEDRELAVDPRAAYCEEGQREIRVVGRNGPPLRILAARRDTYRLELEHAPPEGSRICLPANISAFNKQISAIHRLKDGPLPHHRELLRLCEAPDRVRWPHVLPAAVTRWHLLDDDRFDGTEEQRAFVRKALGTPDFAFLEGPPGSGKTHAICELVLQLIERGQRVLLCSTTHVAVDNVLERLIGRFPSVEAVRIGRVDRVDPRVQACQLDQGALALVEAWRSAGRFPELDAKALERAAEQVVLAAANLTCGTTTGILAHPYLEGDAREAGRWAHFDVLILDEASRTTFQEFLVPAQLARRWVIVGDVKQLPPFSERRDLEASLAAISDEEHPSFDAAHQRACLLAWRLRARESAVGQIRWLVVEPAAMLDALEAELAARADPAPSYVRLRSGDPDLAAMGASLVLVEPALLGATERWLPADLARVDDASDAWSRRNQHWSSRHGALGKPIRDRHHTHHAIADIAAAQKEFLSEETWAGQVAWRLGRVHMLASSRNAGDRENRQRELEALLPLSPDAGWVAPSIDAVRDVGVRSVVEALRVPREAHRVRRRSALTDAIPPGAWKERSVLLSFQHRMHPAISAHPSAAFYDGEALHDANTLEGRDARVGWAFGLPGGSDARRVWLDVRGTETRGANRDEAEAAGAFLDRWRRWAEAHPRKDGKPWEVACLSPYFRQEMAMRDMLRALTGHRKGETRFELPNTQIVCATVDRFQGREADVVLLSLRNRRRPGHLDSPNRLNVAITRARFLLVIVGDREFHRRCPAAELADLAEKTPALPLSKEKP